MGNKKRRVGRTGTPLPDRGWGVWREALTVVNRATGEEKPVPDGYRFIYNNKYNVHMRTLKSENTDRIPDMVHLSICRQDRKPIHDWRDFQRIKNELVGPECEGTEIYPADSRLVDSANQYHLWVFTEPGFRVPWGFNERLVTDSPPDPGAVQRPFTE